MKKQFKSGQSLYRRAKRVIPGGNMLLSKRPEMFLPDFWPAYFSKTKACYVWDLDGNKYTDMSLMGVGTNILGYNCKDVDRAVAKVVSEGNLSTLNCPEEVFLAERLVDIHSFADMARFCRSGGEANAVAIRIARAATGRDKIAVCGYHGWHDWYLAANLSNKSELSSHLLPGLNPLGVPKGLKNSILTFNYNRLDELEKILKDNSVAAIKMEVIRNAAPKDNFLKKVRELADKHGSVLIFDECTTGFRETFGGIHKRYGVEPDIAIFGKTMGNGYAITAVIGKRSIMDIAQETFISSTFWTERIGPTAALATLEVMEKENTGEQIINIGNKVKKGWSEIADSNNLDILISGIPSLCGFTLKGNDTQKFRTLITQEMLKRGYLATTSIYSCLEHSDAIIDNYMNDLNDVFKLIRSCQDEVNNIDELLDGDVCHTGFSRLN